jgi:HAMP domain-containing protein|tara:strand:- start:1455 stop:1742 length:288 start_codon:yes stop_codon:yes gene_type:complete
MSNIDKFLTLFSQFDMIVEPKRENPPRQKDVVPQIAMKNGISDLKKALKRLTQEYKRAQKSFKNNRISRQELFDFEWRLFEINDEISRLERDDIE